MKPTRTKVSEDPPCGLAAPRPSGERLLVHPESGAGRPERLRGRAEATAAPALRHWALFGIWQPAPENSQRWPLGCVVQVDLNQCVVCVNFPFQEPEEVLRGITWLCRQSLRLDPEALLSVSLLRVPGLLPD